MTDKNEVIKLLEDFAGKIGQGVDYAWPHVCRSIAIEGWTGLVMCLILPILFVAASILMTIKHLKYKKTSKRDIGVEVGYEFLNGTIIVAALIIMGICSSELPKNLSKALEPEGYLIRKVIGK